MNKFFEQLLGEGRINPSPVFEYQHNGETRKVYEFSGSGQGLSAGRFLELGDTVRAFDELKLTGEDLEMYLHLIKENNKKIISYVSDPDSIIEIVNQNQYLTKQLEIRREYADPGVYLLTFGSFILIEEDENPLIYNQEYNKKKIARWQKDLEVEKKIPLLRTMLPLFPAISRYSDKRFLNYLRSQNAEEYTTLQLILSKEFLTGQESETGQFLRLRMETLQEYENLLRELLSSTIDITPNGTIES